MADPNSERSGQPDNLETGGGALLRVTSSIAVAVFKYVFVGSDLAGSISTWWDALRGPIRHDRRENQDEHYRTRLLDFIRSRLPPGAPSQKFAVLLQGLPTELTRTGTAESIQHWFEAVLNKMGASGEELQSLMEALPNEVDLANLRKTTEAELATAIREGLLWSVSMSEFLAPKVAGRSVMAAAVILDEALPRPQTEQLLAALVRRFVYVGVFASSIYLLPHLVIIALSGSQVVLLYQQNKNFDEQLTTIGTQQEIERLAWRAEHRAPLWQEDCDESTSAQPNARPKALGFPQCVEPLSCTQSPECQPTAHFMVRAAALDIHMHVPEGGPKSLGLSQKTAQSVALTQVGIASDTRPDLREARLDGVPLVEEDLSRSRLDRAVLSGARFVDWTCRDCVLNGTWLANGFTANEASLEEATIKASCGDDAVFTGAHFDESILECATFVGAEFQSADFNAARISGVDFSLALMGGAMFTGANPPTLNDVRFVDARLEGADFSKATIESVDFSLADIRDAKFIDTAFQDVQFFVSTQQTVRVSRPLPCDVALLRATAWV